MFKVLKSLLAGIVAGTALGVLFSPKKGEDIRKNFKKELKEGGTGLKTLRETVTGIGEDIGDTVSETCDEVKKSTTYKKGKAKVRKVLKKAVSKGRKVVRKAKKTVSGKKSKRK